MAYNHYAELVVADSTTGRPLANQVVKLLDFETGAEVDAYRDDVATLLVSGANGLVTPFQTLDATRRVKMIVGGVEYSRWCDEMILQVGNAVDELERLTVTNLAIDTDGTPYISIGSTGARILIDTDGTPYFEQV
ncbi:hypothetical protein HD598_002175 [Neomicrococcus aestuarii]|uniref:Uncharacterized protein n=1 Tax=Neomicrococcus aestuarii TaxID=556325 RepID=A0A7W8TVC8_9MICC|nr:hypothetical protein [Neomicrococcus aestuarii]MBB5513488.1 hypothetical protein [Neomicrococcus aestuarii]